MTPSELKGHLSRLRESSTLEEALLHLESVSDCLNSKMMAWAPDVSRPYFERTMDDFNRRQGWPDELMQLWWDDHATIKMPVYIRCRVERLPFVTDLRVPLKNPLSTSAGNAGRCASVAQRATAMTRQLGVSSLITVPIHLPRGRVAMLCWAFVDQAQHSQQLLNQFGAELFAAGHFFMDAYLRQQEGESGKSRVSRLTPREWEVLRLTAQGFREREVAKLSGVSETTVRFHINNVIRKFGAVTRIHAIVLAAQGGLLGPIGW